MTEKLLTSFRGYVRWRVGVICLSLGTYVNLHTPEVNGLHGEKWFLFDLRHMLEVFARSAESFLNIFNVKFIYIFVVFTLLCFLSHRRCSIINIIIIYMLKESPSFFFSNKVY